MSLHRLLVPVQLVWLKRAVASSFFGTRKFGIERGSTSHRRKIINLVITLRVFLAGVKRPGAYRTHTETVSRRLYDPCCCSFFLQINIFFVWLLTNLREISCSCSGSTCPSILNSMKWLSFLFLGIVLLTKSLLFFFYPSQKTKCRCFIASPMMSRLSTPNAALMGFLCL